MGGKEILENFKKSNTVLQHNNARPNQRGGHRGLHPIDFIRYLFGGHFRWKIPFLLFSLEEVEK